MDNGTKLSPEQIKNLLSAFKNAGANDTVNANDFIKNNLSPAQAQAVKKIIGDPELMKKIISGKKTKEMFERLKGEYENES